MTHLSPEARPARVAGARHGWLLMASCWLSSTGAVLIAPVLPQMRHDYAGVPHADVLTLIVLVIPALMIALFSPLVGSLVDAFGRKRLYLAAVAIYAVAGVLPFWLTSLYAIVAARAVIGLAEAAIVTIATALVANYFSGMRRQKWLTMQHASASVVAALMFAVGGGLGSLAAGWRTPFLVYGCAILFLPFIAVMIWEPGEKTHVEHAPVQTLPFPWREIGLLCLLILFASVMFFVVPVQISFLLSERGVTAPAILGFGGAIANAGIPVGSFAFHRLARWPINRLLVIAFGLLALGFFVIASCTGANATVAGAFLAAAGAGMALPLLGTWTLARVPFAQSGRATGGYMGSFFLGNFLSPLIVESVARFAGGLIQAVAWLAVACAGTAVAVLILTLAKRGPSGSVHAAQVNRVPLG
ncbi:MFS transporter [Paraburkholderia terricola]|uniref:MFS family permease n=1 Tax=Paraburkholderia terricola TaxID=169427 RepID=A0ABU1LNS9_9BURK|nr:MFS transporter [Paraburkholderia terricola]MDR6408398.1 MFS family permease [Paraburkholderia terricola]MDR6481680.1 MFS family permease [Paraburkholderia terricola]